MYNEIVNSLDSISQFASSTGLERGRQLLHDMNNPEKSLKIIHVAGTNGKGSVCSFISNALQAQGYKVGLYTSPYLEKFTERISVPIFTNDELVSFALSYSSELGYKIDEMAILALHNRISNIERLDQATTLTEVKEIVDEAIDREAHGGLKKAISILTAKRYTEDDKIVLTENYFEQK